PGSTWSSSATSLIASEVRYPSSSWAMSSAGMTALRNSGKRGGSDLISSTAWAESAISGLWRGNQGSPSGPPPWGRRLGGVRNNSYGPAKPGLPGLCRGNQGSPSGPPPWGRRLGGVRNNSYGPAKPGLPATLSLDSCGGRSSAVRVSEDRVRRSDDRDHVRHHVAERHVLDRLQVHERRGAELHAPRLVRAVGHDIAAVLSAPRFHGHVDVAGRRRVALCEELEVVDERLHRRVQLFAGRRQDLAIVHVHGPARQAVKRLAQDLDRLPHLLDSHQVARVAVARILDRDLPVVCLEAAVGPVFAQVPRDARAPDHGPCCT